MAFNLTNGIGGRRSRGLPAMAEINVTPFVDVVLVLLIIFMITAHVMEYGIEVDVPKTKSVTSSVKELPVVTISPTGEVYLGSTPVSLPKLASEIRTRFPGQTAAYVRADKTTQYDPIAQVLVALQTAKIAANMVTRPDDARRTSR
jgi:biopolymer transport protein ExbD